jgi:hypothetical protein
VYTVVIVSFMVHVIPHVIPHVMVLFFLGRWEKFQVLHSRLRRHRTTPIFVKVLETFGLMRLTQLFRGEFIHLATQNRGKKEGEDPRGPPPLALDR